MEPWQIILLVFGILTAIVVLLYFLCWFAIFLYLLVNSTRMKLKERVINSILAQQYDLIRLLRISIEEEKIELPEDVYVRMELHHKRKMEKKNATELMEIKESLSAISSKLMIIADGSSLKDTKKYEALKESLNEFSANYRKETILYNQMLNGHNYWTNFFAFKFFFKHSASRMVKERIIGGSRVCV